MSSVAPAVGGASSLTSVATTAKPRPASPARAASIVAFSASRLVCPAMAWMRLTTSPMRGAALGGSPAVGSSKPPPRAAHLGQHPVHRPLEAGNGRSDRFAALFACAALLALDG